MGAYLVITLIIIIVALWVGVYQITKQEMREWKNNP